MPASLLIDGYNLLFASNVFAAPSGPPTLQRTREALLQFLAAALDGKTRRRTTIVFDAANAPPGLSHKFKYAEMTVLFSRNPHDADAFIEEILGTVKSPREVKVVSSDHRVQRAARQRGAGYIDSERWYRDLRRAVQANDKAAELAHPSADDWSQTPELRKWLQEFGDIDVDALKPPEMPIRPRTDLPNVALSPAMKPQPPATKPTKPSRTKRDEVEKKSNRGIGNPFPPGYGEDLLE